MKIIENIKNQDNKQKTLLTIFLILLIGTAFNVYFSFFAKSGTTSAMSGSTLTPLKVNVKVLDSEVFTNLKNN